MRVGGAGARRSPAASASGTTRASSTRASGLPAASARTRSRIAGGRSGDGAVEQRGAAERLERLEPEGRQPRLAERGPVAVAERGDQRQLLVLEPAGDEGQRRRGSTDRATGRRRRPAAAAPTRPLRQTARRRRRRRGSGPARPRRHRRRRLERLLLGPGSAAARSSSGTSSWCRPAKASAASDSTPTCVQGPRAGRARPGPVPAEQRRLADPGFAADEQRAALAREGIDQLVDASNLVFSPDQRRYRVRGRPGGVIHEAVHHDDKRPRPERGGAAPRVAMRRRSFERFSAGRLRGFDDQLRRRAGLEIIGTWEAFTSSVCAPIRCASKRRVAGGIAWSCLPISNQDGIVFQAGARGFDERVGRERPLGRRHHRRLLGREVGAEHFVERLLGDVDVGDADRGLAGFQFGPPPRCRG